MKKVSKKIYESVMYFIIFCWLSFHEINQYDEYIFSKTNYIKIDKWEKEIIDGQTHYVIMFGNKTIVVSPLDYPEVRNINSNTKIKILPRNNVNLRGFLQINMLDIKN